MHGAIGIGVSSQAHFSEVREVFVPQFTCSLEKQVVFDFLVGWAWSGICLDFFPK